MKQKINHNNIPMKNEIDEPLKQVTSVRSKYVLFFNGTTKQHSRSFRNVLSLV